MKVIDAHVHFSNISKFKECAQSSTDVNYTKEGYLSETSSIEVVKTICMGLTETSLGGFPDKKAQTPMCADLESSMPEGMHLCLGINPHTLSERNLAETEEIIRNNLRVVGMKIYAGYYHVDINDRIYNDVYDLAEKHDKTIVIHTGDTYSSRGLLKYAHPLCVDELAVSRPDLRIVACHMGAPWVFDACEVALKNPNVYIDTSGLFVGNKEYIKYVAAESLLIDRYLQALEFLNNYNKIIYGTDWPFAPMSAYFEFCKKLIPVEAHEKVFYENAVKVYKL